jgi:hypothetical protein
LSPEEKGELVLIVLAGRDPEASGISAFTREDLGVRICQKRFGKGLHVTWMGRILRELGVVAKEDETELTRKRTRPRKRRLKEPRRRSEKNSASA